ncbi:MAG: hypothetical protein ACREAA_15755 [Candidatus Polarisedimenticolia bacterium]
MRLGEALIQKGMLSEKQLTKALHAQLIFGAHLGTCLLELGYIDEKSLSTHLSELHGVPCASAESLKDIQPHVLALLPAAVAERLMAIPFHQQGRQLKVALVDPRSLPILDEVAFITGCRVEPFVAPEIRIFQALEKYYEVTRRQRYVALARQLDNMEVKEQARVVTAAVGSESPVAETPMPRGPVPTAEWVDDVRPQLASRKDGWLTEAAERLCGADDVAGLGKIVAQVASKDMARCALFSVKASKASLWECHGFHAPPPAFKVTLEPLFTLPHGEPVYKGAVPDQPDYVGFFDRLGVSRPHEVLIAPVYAKERLAALFYGDGGDSGSLNLDPDEYVRLFKKLSLAMGMLVLKKQIRLV